MPSHPRTLRPLRPVALMAAFLPLAGCTGGPPGLSSSEEEAKVAGTIKVAGQPATQGQVTFDPSSTARKSAVPRTATIGKDGSYSVTTLVGQNRVRFSGLSTKRNVSFDEVACQVRPGSMTFDLDLPEAQPRRGR